jgi:tRNA 2-thiouridine synthesizing protein A
MAVTFEKKGENSFLLDVTGYVCPHPQLYTKKALQNMKENDILELIFDNPSSGESISSMCDRTGDEILEKNSNNGVFNFTIKKI